MDETGKTTQLNKSNPAVSQSRRSRRRRRMHYKGLVGVLVVYLLIGIVLLEERSGIKVTYGAGKSGGYLPVSETITAEQAVRDIPHVCLMITDSENEDSILAAEQYRRVLLDMKTGFDEVDISREDLPDLSAYRTCVLLESNLEKLGEDILTITDWVYDGGRVLFGLKLERDMYTMVIEQKLGIQRAGYENVLVDSYVPTSSFMIGGGRSYDVVDPFDSAWSVNLDDTAELLAGTGDNDVPLLWKRDYGKGRFVVNNFAVYEKALRGVYADAYSMLEDVCAWPVLNGAVFYLDDFPSPVPSGDGEYIRRDYQTSISDFYANVWWPDLLYLAERFGIRYTGVIIETYDDDTHDEPERQQDTSRFQYFGNMLMHMGGEIGYHGYNHQPLCLDGFDYEGMLPYNTWPDMEHMYAAMKELTEFGEEMFPSSARSVYVPPSNVISQDGVDLLAQRFDNIRSIASIYFAGDVAFEQEFGCSEDGMIHQPRIVSGGSMDDYMKMAALSELNMHYVFSHFMHPDDLLDEERGAEKGWQEYRRNLYEVFGWLFEEAPSIRRLTGSEMAASVQRFSALTVDWSMQEETVHLSLGNFHDEAFLLVRLSCGTPVKTQGGSLTKLTDTLYLLQADQDQVDIVLE